MPFDISQLRKLTAPPESAGQRLDSFLTRELRDLSRSRVQRLLEKNAVEVDGKPGKASRKLRGGEEILVTGEPEPLPLRAVPEAIPLEIVYEDDDLAVVNKPAGMMVHAGSGLTDDARNMGTLVNALLHHMRELSQTSGPLRPGIVHRLDKQTSGLIIVAKNDLSHARLAGMFSRRQVHKTYLALVQGSLKGNAGTVNASIGRDAVRRTRMTTRREGGRVAISHWEVIRRIEGEYGRFTLVSVRIETGRTHQIRVHMSSLGHPIVGDTLYGAAASIAPLVPEGKRREPGNFAPLALPRNFLHAAQLEFAHPRTGERISLKSELPAELLSFLAQLAEKSDPDMPRRGD